MWAKEFGSSVNKSSGNSPVKPSLLYNSACKSLRTINLSRGAVSLSSTKLNS